MSEEVHRNNSEINDNAQDYFNHPMSTEKILHTKGMNVPQTMLKTLVSLFSP